MKWFRLYWITIRSGVNKVAALAGEALHFSCSHWGLIMRGHGNRGWHSLFLCFDLIYFICGWLEDIIALLFLLEEYPSGLLAPLPWLRRLRLLVLAEWISAHQCDLIMKALFFVFIMLRNSDCFSPTPSSGVCVILRALPAFFFDCVFIQT